MGIDLRFIYTACHQRVTLTPEAFAAAYPEVYLLVELDAVTTLNTKRTSEEQPRLEASLIHFGGVALERAYRFRLATLTGDSFTIGRNDKCDVVLAGDAACSSFHARLSLPPRIADLGSRNGTLVGDKVLKQGEVPLDWGEPVVVGKTTISVMRAAELYDALATVLNIDQR